jgi:diguanylate cyclase (GGDEF)-like protein
MMACGRLNEGQSVADIRLVAEAAQHLRVKHDRFGLDSVLLLAYVACFVIVTGSLPLGGNLIWSEVGAGLGLQALVGLLLAAGPHLKLARPGPVGMLGVVMYLVSVGLLRDGATATAGYGPLVLLPVVWASLRGGRGVFAVSLGGVAAVYLVPELIIGAPQYPVGGWRAGLLFVVVAAVIGLALRRLVARVEQLVQRLGDLARTDALTGLPNRRAWQEILEREITQARRSGRPFSIALLDLDRFKQYNDTHGHLAGDRLLVSATAAWRSALREPDVLARWGGDEFVLLLPDCDVHQTEALLNRIRAACPEAPFSAGLAESGGESPPEALLAVADQVLYRAKRRQAAPATLRADADHQPARPQGPGSPEEEARHTGLEVG